ncbi:type II toxin-antitoxin system RelB/DinJ family antitoxin [Gluconobacter kondonii]|uniref:type II toxin-antitoxin system RelB/DinJ family antitoxin n=1 Tax=Gluconobacter kondonii TaxID=941463 RepID=UPI001B8BF9AF|nr:type II toxin-antitoxin system RelB/DinJ family antitoxin [Gluconobacter kondonii]MBS1084567.1 type II toxin-antitoxin system RelB/DinJ family antitoxin [Gluconobacter kondonii]
MTGKLRLTPVDVSCLLESEEERESFMQDALATGDQEIIARAQMMIDEAMAKQMNDDSELVCFVSDEEKQVVMDVCEQEGVTLSEVVEMLFQHIVDHKALPPFLVERTTRNADDSV